MSIFHRRAATIHIPMLLILCAAMLGGILYGYDIGVMSMAVLYIKESILLSNTQLELIVGAVFVGGIVGALAAGYCADRYGRRVSILLSCLFFILGAYLVQSAVSFPPLFIARFALGIGVGFISVIIPLYTAELAAANNRGRMISLFQLALTAGILLSYLIDCFLAKGHHWRQMFAVIFVPALSLLSLIIFLPESPRWLLFHKNSAAALKALQFIHPPAAAATELHIIQTDYQQHLAKLSQKKVLPFKLLAFVILLASCNQLIGANALLQYAPYVLKLTGGQSGQFNGLGTVSVGLMNMIFTLISFTLVDRLGRKPLLLIGICGVILANAYLGSLSLWTLAPTLKATLYLLGLLLYICSFAIGPGVVVWLLMSELLPTPIRSKGMAIALFFNSLASVLTTSTFLTIVQHWGLASIHWFFMAAALVYLVAVLQGLPETKNLLLEQVTYAPIKLYDSLRACFKSTATAQPLTDEI